MSKKETFFPPLRTAGKEVTCRHEKDESDYTNFTQRLGEFERKQTCETSISAKTMATVKNH